MACATPLSLCVSVCAPLTVPTTSESLTEV
jgi:hypothetical protein